MLDVGVSINYHTVDRNFNKVVDTFSDKWYTFYLMS